MWLSTWSDLLHVLAVGTAGYVTLVVLLRLSGKRTLSKLNAFDLVVTVALGSVLATLLLDTGVSWIQGTTALVLLATLQFVAAKTSAAGPRARAAITSEPTLMFLDGRPLPDALHRERVTVDDLRQAVRGTGRGALDGIAAIVLETDGSLSVIARDAMGSGTALERVRGMPADPA